ncbi:3-hydroxybutyryl-CoA dehydrogenase [Breoghania corrubedonensis]|uniref:3-hydroxybutyryl-CoA dehydrogenase n=1 Tax=Breoghania corrubedonensis TaxID=665038 RepID=A0A2T5US78_9HYPH|nr:3-hydroxybutyryl-CoA dehydrogenase [Breoghania corrubedonensis]PTW54377.1 3-hydroxybutyryl-CoA dehydrogenase [Breoghania corrubedonensis]
MAQNDIKAIMVVGAGQMGGGIAQVAAVAGYKVFLNDINTEAVKRGYDRIAANLARNVAKGRSTEDETTAALARIMQSVSLDDAKACDLVIEAATENVSLKSEIFRTLDATAPAHAIFATNTSSVPITELAACTGRADKVIGMHFMNPVPVMKLVEIIRGLETDDATFKTIEELGSKLGKTPVEVKDSPGFVSNRILLPMINEAIYCLYENVGAPEAIDTVMKLGMNHPMGPLALADLIGLDTCLSIMEVLYEGFEDSKYRACPLLRQYVQAGRLGVKSGRGFYTYAAA